MRDPLDYVASGLPKAAQTIEGRRYLDDASPWSFSLLFVVPVAPFLDLRCSRPPARPASASSAIRPELDVAQARDILWSLTSGELYRMLVLERKWAAEEYERWLGALLAAALLKSVH